MTMYIFDESDEYYRCPAGALKAPGTMSLSIKLRRGAATNPRVFLYPDGGGTFETAMRFDHVTGAYDVYKADIAIETAGLYWYNFLVDSFYGSSFSVPELAGSSFQITAYAPAETNPDWIQGGVIYHIFIDRFARGNPSEVVERRSGDERRMMFTYDDKHNDDDRRCVHDRRVGGERHASDVQPHPNRPGAILRPDWGGCPYYLPDERGIVHNNDFFGGDLYGIVEKLPYLEEMGVTCIYLSPVFEAASNHKYDTGDFMKIDSGFGGDKAFELLCTEAGKRGMKVILDGVFNHVGIDSTYFNRYGRYDNEGAFQGEHSPYRDWFMFREDGSYEAWWGIDLLPALNKRNEKCREFICGRNGVIAHWTKKGVSGWRLDVVDELPDEFLDPLCTAMKRENSKALIVGEVWEDASHKIAYSVRRRYFIGGQLDSVTNYPLKDALIACVKDGDVLRLADTMAALCRNYPANVLNSLMNIIGTHDTMRILTVLSGAYLPEGKTAMSQFRLSREEMETAKRRLKLASVLQFTLPGVPCVYYGDEAGMEGGEDPFNRRCYPWGGEDKELLAWYRNLSAIRRDNNCFIDGKYELAEARAGVFAFTRGGGAGRVLIAVNLSGEDRALAAGGFNFDILNSRAVDSLIVKAGEAGIFAIR